jgi:para-aminobenzoate synthetase component 1
LVSTVTGKLKPELNVFDVMRAVFPGGTITGAPKIRSMEIIAELETSARQFYTGALGWICQDEFEFNILIRTAILKDLKNALEGQYSLAEIRVGAGLVADSVPATEYKETLNKAASWQKILNQFSEENQ